MLNVIYKLEGLTFFCCLFFKSFAFQPEHFPFLNVAVSRQVDTRCRTLFYTALGRLLLVELGEDEGRFERFISPITGEDKRKSMLE